MLCNGAYLLTLASSLFSVACMEPRNLVFIMSDEHNARTLGCCGHGIVKTPHIDALAASGGRFTAAYSNCPICVPGWGTACRPPATGSSRSVSSTTAARTTPPGWMRKSSDPSEAFDLARDSGYTALIRKFEAALREVVDPGAADRNAGADQAALVERYGGREAVLAKGGYFGSPAPTD